MRLATLVCLGTLALAACGLDPSKVPSHEVYAVDGAELAANRPVSFAIVGQTRSVAYGVKGEPKAALDVVSDVRDAIALEGLDFLVFTGGYVRRSTNDEWKAFSERWRDVVRGEALSDSKGRKKLLAMPGAGEMLGDRQIKGYGAAFPEMGAEIGYSRTASWGHFDQKVGSETWRFVFVDTHRKAMGSRWQEQLFWLPKVVSGDDFDKLLLFMPEPLVTLANGEKMNRGDAPRELLEVIDDHSGIGKLMAVFSGGVPTNEVYLPDGSYGALHVVAGNSGIGMPDLPRWGPADAAGLKDVSLEPMYDVALQRELDIWAEDLELGDRILDKAKARGEWETYTGTYEGSVFPVQGWWRVKIRGKSVDVTFRQRRHDGTFRDGYSMRYTRRNGWVMAPKK